MRAEIDMPAPQVRKVAGLVLCAASFAVVGYLIARPHIQLAYYKHVLKTSYDFKAARRLNDLPGGRIWLISTFESSPDPRLRAAIVYGWQDDDMATFLLLCGAMSDPDLNVRRSALHVLGARIVTTSQMTRSIALAILATSDTAVKLQLAWALSAATGGGFRPLNSPSDTELNAAARAWLTTHEALEEGWLAKLRQLSVPMATNPGN